MFDILFKYRGKISGKDFMSGFIFIFLIAAVLYNYDYFMFLLLRMIDSNLIIKFNIMNSYGFDFFYTITRLPLNLIIFYCAINLSIKRVKALKLRYATFIGVFIGISFIVLIKVIPNLFLSSFENTFFSMRNIAVNEFISKSLMLLTLMSLISFPILYFFENHIEKVNEKKSYSFSFKGEMDESNYIAHLKKIFLYGFILISIYFILSISLSDFKSNYDAVVFFSTFLKVIVLIVGTVLCICYFNISIQRIRNIGYKGRFIPLSYLAYILIMLGLSNYLSNAKDEISINLGIYGSLLLFVFFSTLQISLVILPEKIFNREINDIE